MTRVYFVRHAKPDFSVHDDNSRPLTKEGIEASKKVTELLHDKSITKIYSSPYKRSVDTVNDLAERLSLDINIIDDFRERKVADSWIEDFNSFAKEQWNNFDYKLPNGESLNEVQKRNIAALKPIIKENRNENIVIATHGTAMSTIINYFTKEFDYNEFKRIVNYMPFVVSIEFKDEDMVNIEEFII